MEYVKKCANKLKEALIKEKLKWKQNMKTFLKTTFLVLGFIVFSIFLMLVFALVIIKITGSAEWAIFGPMLGMVLSILILSYLYPILFKDFDKYHKEKPGGV